MKVRNVSDRPHRFTDYFTRGPIRPKPYVWSPGETLDVPSNIAQTITSAHPGKMELVPDPPTDDGSESEGDGANGDHGEDGNQQEEG